MTRRTILLNPDHVIGAGGWLNLYRLETDGGTREIAARRNGRFRATRCLVLYVEESAWIYKNTSLDLQTFLKRLKEIGLAHFQVFFLATDRPCTYPKAADLEGLAENYVLEGCGGVANAANEDSVATGTRETCEEYGCEPDDVVMTAPLMVGGYLAHDSGGQVEFYSTCLAVVTRRPSPPRREGIVGEKCVLVPLLHAESFLVEQHQRGICLDMGTLTALQDLGLQLHGGWKTLR